MSRIWLLIIILLTGLLGGCETSKKLFMVITDPEVPVGYPDKEATELTVSLLADHDVNPNFSGEATPIDIQLVFLNEDSKLLSLDYYQIATEPLDKVLSKNYIDHQDYTLEPGLFRILKPMKIDPYTQFLAVIAHYSNASDGEAIWMDVKEIDGMGKKYKLLIHVLSDEIEIKVSK